VALQGFIIGFDFTRADRLQSDTRSDPIQVAHLLNFFASNRIHAGSLDRGWSRL